MSKWLKGKEKLFKEFKEKKNEEQENNAGPRRLEIIWKTPEKGTPEKPKIYQMRLLPDPNDNFYKSYFYHMYKGNNGNWNFVFCPKSHGMDKYCPFCSATVKLYQGSKDDKKAAYNYKRKRKHCVNTYIISDPRDAEEQNEDDKVNGKVKVYEYPDAVESTIKSEMNDDAYGAGIHIFDPGEDGFDFILKVGSTKPIHEEGPNKGKTFPDYSNSKFANKSNPIGTDEEIEVVMESTHNLDEYLKTMERTMDDMISLVKEEMLYDHIKSDFPPERSGGKKEEKAKEKSEEKQEDNSSEGEQESTEEKQEDNSSEGESISDDDLLKELESL